MFIEVLLSLLSHRYVVSGSGDDGITHFRIEYGGLTIPLFVVIVDVVKFYYIF